MVFSEDLEEKLIGKDIIVTNTKASSVSFALAHTLRNLARATYCIDPNYNIPENPEGYRRIEDGRVYLIKGSFPAERKRLMDLIENKLGGEVSYVFEAQTQTI